jgi:pyruvate formate lyase activating enzyme
MAIGGKLRAVTYGRPCAVHIDPVEKKPLFHFIPGARTLSLATAGCNLSCKCCQNWTISQANPEDIKSLDLPPKKVVQLATRQSCRAIAYTYTDPAIFFEYALDCSMMANEVGLKNIAVTAGYLKPKPMRRISGWIDAANTDLKAFSDRFYQEICGARLKPVLDGLVIMKENNVWIEITNLLIPTFNDDPNMIRDLCRWTLANLGPDTPVHFTRFHPMYRLRNLPPTPAQTLSRARRDALDIGLRHVYVGNLLGTDAQNTYCPNDNEPVILRNGFSVISNRLNNGKCPKCNEKIAGVWS